MALNISVDPKGFIGKDAFPDVRPGRPPRDLAAELAPLRKRPGNWAPVTEPTEAVTALGQAIQGLRSNLYAAATKGNEKALGFEFATRPVDSVTVGEGDEAQTVSRSAIFARYVKPGE